MKKVTILLTFLFFSSFAFSQVFDESFESYSWPPAGWTLIPEYVDGWWMPDDGTYFGPGTAYNGSFAAMFDNYDYPAGATGSMITNSFDLSGYYFPTLSFYWWNNDDASTPAKLEVYGFDGTDYVLIEEINTYGSGANTWVNFSEAIPSNITKLKFTAISDNGLKNTFIDLITIKEAAPEIVTLELEQSIDESNWTSLGGAYPGGFTMDVDKLVTKYYLNFSASTATNVVLEEDYYGFYLENYPADFFDYWAEQGVVEGAGSWQAVMWEIINGNTPIFYAKVTGTTMPQTVMLVDGLRHQLGYSDTYLNFDGYFPDGDYTFTGSVTNFEGTESDIFTIPLTINDVTDYPEFTVIELKKATAPPIYFTVDGNMEDGFYMQLDPAVPYYYLDFTNETVTDLPIAEDYYPFFLKTDNLPDGYYDYWAAKGVYAGCNGSWEPTMWEIITGQQPIFFVNVYEKKGTQGFALVDGLTKILSGTDETLKVNGEYPLGTYSFEGTLTSDEGIVSQPLGFDMTFLPLPFTLPFCENWDSMDFATNYWSLDPTENNNWTFYYEGSYYPMAIFNWYPQQSNYENSLVSYELDGTEITDKIFIKFDLELYNYSSDTYEWLTANVYDGTSWHEVGVWDNQGNDIETTEVIDISAYAVGKIFKVAFIAGGEDTWNLYYWTVDNICVYQPAQVTGTVTALSSGNPINGAEIAFGDLEPATTLADGTYEKWVMEGTYDVTASATGFNPLTLTDYEIILGVTNTVDFALTAPIMTVDPNDISDILWYGETSTHDITITNTGDGPLSWSTTFVYDKKSSTKSTIHYETPDKLTAKTVPGNHQNKPDLPKSSVLWDNTNINSITSGIVSSELTGVVPDGRVITADDFIVPSGENWIINFVYSEGFSNLARVPDAFAVEFYEDLDGAPGNMIYTENITPADINVSTQLLYLASPLQLTGGHYWVSVYGVYNGATSLSNARWNWFTGSIPIAGEAALSDFGGFFGLPAGWFYLSQLGITQPSCYFIIGGDKTGMFTFSQTSGTINAGDSQIITVTFDANQVPGTYNSTLTFYSDPDVGEEEVDLSLTIRGQEIMVPAANDWGLISTYYDMANKAFDPSMENLLAEIEENMVILIGEEGIYWPGQNVNTIGDWNNHFGYKIKMSADDQLVFTGTPLTDKNVTFSAGTHIVPVPTDEDVPVSLVLVPQGNKIIFAYDMDQNLLYWPPYVNTLTTLKPGFAYLIKFAATTTLDFEVPKAGIIETISNKFENNTSWNDVIETGDVHFVGIEEEATSDLVSGDFIGVFNTSGVCAGMTQYNGLRGKMAFAVYGNDETTNENDGLNPGEMMTIKIFRNGETFETTPVYNNQLPNADGNFAFNGLSAIQSFKVGALSVENDPMTAIKIYPNPSTGIFNINLTGISNPIEIIVTNSQGQLIYSGQLSGSQQLDLSNQPNGVYFVRLVNEKSVRLEKLIIK